MNPVDKLTIQAAQRMVQTANLEDSPTIRDMLVATFISGLAQGLYTCDEAEALAKEIEPATRIMF